MLAEQLAKLRVERDEMSARFQELPELAFESRLEAIRANPSQRSDAGVNSRPRRLSKEQQELIRSMDTADEEIRALEQVLEEATVADLQERFQGLEAEAERLWGAEVKTWQEVGHHFKELVEARGKLVALWQKREQVKAERAGELIGLLNASPDAAETFKRLLRHRVVPVPETLAAFLAMVVDATCDPHGRGYRDFGGQRLDNERQLVELLPDLRQDAAVKPAELTDPERRG